MRKYLFTLIVFNLFCITHIGAQLNFGVGYSLGFIDPEIDNQIISDFNTDRPWLDDELEQLNFIQGLHLSLRYKLDFVALDFTWRNKFRSKRASGIDPANSQSFERR